VFQQCRSVFELIKVSILRTTERLNSCDSGYVDRLLTAEKAIYESTRNTRKHSDTPSVSSRLLENSRSLRSRGAGTFRHRPERAESQVKQGRGDTETQFRSLVVVQQVILSEVLQKPDSTRSMMALKVEPLIIEVTTCHADEQVGGSRPGTSYSPRQ